MRSDKLPGLTSSDGATRSMAQSPKDHRVHDLNDIACLCAGPQCCFLANLIFLIIWIEMAIQILHISSEMRQASFLGMPARYDEPGLAGPYALERLFA